MSDALGTEISVPFGFTTYLLCCKRMDLPVHVSLQAELGLKSIPV